MAVFQEFLARMEKAYSDWPIARFCCDNGRGEYDNRLFRGILRVSGISFEPAPPYTQHKNGKSERIIQTLVTKAHTMLIDAKLPTAMWAEAISTAAYLHEHSPSRPLQHKTPYEMLNQGKKPVIHHLRRFCCQAYKLLPPPQRKHKKFGERSRLCTIIGYVHDATTMWGLWDTVEGRMITASNVIFNKRVIVGDVGFEDVLKEVLPEEVYTDEECEEHEERLPSESLVEKKSPSVIPSTVLDEEVRSKSLVEKWAPSNIPSTKLDEELQKKTPVERGSPGVIPSTMLDEGLQEKSPIEREPPGDMPSKKLDEKISAKRSLQKVSAARDSEKESSEAVPETRFKLRRSCRI